MYIHYYIIYIYRECILPYTIKTIIAVHMKYDKVCCIYTLHTHYKK